MNSGLDCRMIGGFPVWQKEKKEKRATRQCKQLVLRDGFDQMPLEVVKSADLMGESALKNKFMRQLGQKESESKNDKKLKRKQKRRQTMVDP